MNVGNEKPKSFNQLVEYTLLNIYDYIQTIMDISF